MQVLKAIGLQSEIDTALYLTCAREVDSRGKQLSAGDATARLRIMAAARALAAHLDENASALHSNELYSGLAPLAVAPATRVGGLAARWQACTCQHATCELQATAGLLHAAVALPAHAGQQAPPWTPVPSRQELQVQRPVLHAGAARQQWGGAGPGALPGLGAAQGLALGRMLCG